MTIVSQTTYSGPGTPSVAPGATAAPAAQAPAAPAAAPVQPFSGKPAESSPLVAPKPGEPAAPEAKPEAKPDAEPKAPLSLEPEAKPTPDPSEKPGTVVEYDKTGDAGLDMALSFLGKLGYGPEHPAMMAAAAGDFGMLKAELAAKGVAGAAEHLALGEQAYKRVQEAKNVKEAEDRKKIMEIVGGEKQWADIQKWAASKADPEERASIGAALRSGGIVARAVAAHLANAFAQAGGTTVNPAQVTRDGSAQRQASTSGALSPVQYKAAINELKARVGGVNLDAHPEYAALKARRMAWRE